MTEVPSSPSVDPTTEARLGPVAAMWNALWGRKADFYPLIAEGGVVSTLDTLAMLREMEEASESWTKIKDDDVLKNALDLAKQSLAEVKAQTEYQDQKATRLLTVTTFLSALSGILFSRFEGAHPFTTISHQSFGVSCFLMLGYVAFAAFIFFSLSGALVTFHAIRTRFKYPPTQNTDDQDKDPRSLLFYAPMIRSRPRSWIGGWVTANAAGNASYRPALRDDLRQRYLQHLVSETYLVAAKTADKLRYLEPAQSLLAYSLRCLFIWLLLLASLSIFAPKAPTTPIEVKLVSQALPMPPVSQAPLPSPQPPSAPNAGAQPVMTAPATDTAGQHP